MTGRTTIVTLREALQTTMANPERNLGFLYLPEQPWTLDTRGAFFDYDIDLDPKVDQTPEIIKENNWKETLDSDLIDQMIFNARAQRSTVRIEELLDAFVYFVNNDAFLEFK
jgi:hypothetical protein